jgi:hypothetical protein
VVDAAEDCGTVRAAEDAEGVEEDVGEGALWGTSGGVVVDETDGMITPQTVDDGLLAVRKRPGAARRSRPADILIYFVGIIIPLEGDDAMRPVSPRIRDNPERNRR